MTVHHIARAHGSTSTSGPHWQVSIESGTHPLSADEPAPGGGADAGPSPFGLVTSGLVACTAMTLRMYAERKEWELAFLDVAISYDVDDEGHASFVRTVTVPNDLPEEQRTRLAEIAEKTPVTLALRQGTPINTTFEVRAAS